MTYRQLFFIEGRLVGEAERKPVFFHEEKVSPPSLLWVCRCCGEVYARAPVVNPFGELSEFHTITRMCRKHAPKSMFEVPGSLWNSWDPDLLAAFPVSVMREEVLRHIDCLERVENESQNR